MKNICIILCLVLFGLGQHLHAQYTFGTEVQSTPSASITYTSGTGAFQYSDTSGTSGEYAYVPLTGTAATVITTSTGWTATLAVNLAPRSITNNGSQDGDTGMGLAIYSGSLATHIVIELEQVNNSDGGDNSDFPNGLYGTAAKFAAETNGTYNATTLLGSSQAGSSGDSYLQLTGGTLAANSASTKSILSAVGVVTLSYNASTNIVTGYYNGAPLGSYSLAGWGANPPLTLVVAGSSGTGANVPSGTDSASNFNAASGSPIDVGNYGAEKEIAYDQTSASAPTLDPVTPYQFGANIDVGTSGALFTNANLTPSVGSTGVVLFTTGTNLFSSGSANSLSYRESFASKAALDAAFGSGAGIYNLTLQTTTPNNYSDQFSFGTEDYPAIPQITGMTNASWSAKGTLLVGDIAQPVSITWSNPGAAFINFYLNNSSISTNGQGLTTYMIPANAFSNNTYYQGNIQATVRGNGATNTNTIPGNSGFAGFQTLVSFTIQTGSPASSSTTLYSIEKDHVLVQTSASAPVNGTGDSAYFTPAPYRIIIKSPMAGTVAGPSSTSYPLGYAVGGGNNNYGDYEFSSGAVTSQASLDTAYLDGSYTLTDGNTVSLTGDGYPAVAQIIAVNNNPPVWDAQGQLVLDPTIANTIMWSTVTVPNFATNGLESANFFSNGAAFTSVKLQAGVATSSSTPFTSLTILANTMTPGATFSGKIKYYDIPSVSNPNANVYDIAGYETETDFAAIATYPTGLLQAIGFPAPANQAAGAAPFALNATATSGLPVSYNLVSGPATLSGTNNSTVTVTGLGTVVIQANQAGGGIYAAAAPVQQSFTVSQGSQTITFPAIATQPYSGSSFSLNPPLNATASSGLPVSYSLVSGPATLSGTNNGVVTITGIGTVTIQADQAGDSNHLAAPSVMQSFTVAAPVGFTGNPTATPFNDGIPNLFKYLYDISTSQPLTATDRAALPVAGAATSGNNHYLTLTYRQYALKTGITVNVQTSANLQNWTTVSPPDFSQQVGVDANTGDPIMETGVLTNGTNKQFIRLDVTMP